MSKFTPLALALAAMLVVGTACQDKDKDSMKSDSMSMKSGKSLWDRLGGEPAVRAVVDDFVGRAVKDDKVNFFRHGHPNEWKPNDTQVATFKQRLVEFISMASGGPLKYKGRDMATAHKGMEITSAEFDALAGDLAASLDHFKVPAKEKGELLAAVAGTKGQIVGK
jgi:hemoglobin